MTTHDFDACCFPEHKPQAALPFESSKQPELLDNKHVFGTAAAAAAATARIVLMLFSSS
jgi:hypothetical protein